MRTTPSFINGGESLGMPAGMDPTRPKRNFWAALANASPDENATPMEADAAAGSPPPKARLVDRIEDDPIARHSNPAAGSTEDLESAADRSRLSLADQMSQGAKPNPVPSHMDDLEAQYNQLTPQKPTTLKGKIIAALQGFADSPKHQMFEENQHREERGTLLQQIEAERRMQEQEQMQTERERMAQQAQTERERAAQEAQGRLFTQQQTLEDQREAARSREAQAGREASEVSQGRLFAQQEKMQDARLAAQIAAQNNRDDSANSKLASKRYETAMDADQRLSRMEASYGKAVKGDQQAMLALLADHLGMTLGMQKGARITKDILQEAQQSQPWLAKIGAKFDDRGYLSGVALGPDQMRQMLDLGYEARDRAVQGAYDDSQLYGVKPPKGADAVFSKRKMGDKPALQGGGGAGGAGTVRIRDSRGFLHDLPAASLEKARQRDPGLQVVQ